MTSYLFHDKNKAAFLNGVNSLFKKNSLSRTISSEDIINAPSPAKAEFTLYSPLDDKEAGIIDYAIKSRHFGFQIKKINLTSIMKESWEDFFPNSFPR